MYVCMYVRVVGVGERKRREREKREEKGRGERRERKAHPFLASDSEKGRKGMTTGEGSR